MAVSVWEQGHGKREAELELATDVPDKRIKLEAAMDAQRVQS